MSVFKLSVLILIFTAVNGVIRADVVAEISAAMERMESGSNNNGLTGSQSQQPLIRIYFPIRAVALMTAPRDSSIRGVVLFTQSSPENRVVLTGNITGLPPNTWHAFDIHQNGLSSDNCDSAGDHFNPDFVPGQKQQSMGSMHMDPMMELGNMGDILSDDSGAVQLNITNTLISLFSRNNVIGRTITVHESVHDSSGEAGKRLGCGAIGVLLD